MMPGQGPRGLSLTVLDLHCGSRHAVSVLLDHKVALAIYCAYNVGFWHEAAPKCRICTSRENLCAPIFGSPLT